MATYETGDYVKVELTDEAPGEVSGFGCAVVVPFGSRLPAHRTRLPATF
jgi:hypothetical protein